MISDITLGQFFPGGSLLHRLDPRTKILLAIAYIVTIFLINNVAGFIFMTLLTLMLVLISSISFRTVIKGIKPILIILLFTAIIQLFFTTADSEPLVSFWIINIYVEGIIRAVFMSLRVVLLIVGSSVLLTYTTSPISLTNGIESLLTPLKRIGVPIHSFAMMMTIALRFIPTLVEETEKIMNAQKSRGADFSSGSIIRRIKMLVSIIVPLFASSIKRAEELAVAMECRGYRGDVNRTKMVKLELRARDYVSLVVAALLVTAVALLRSLPYSYELTGVFFDVIFYKI